MIKTTNKIKTLEFKWLIFQEGRLMGLTTKNQKFVSSQVKGLVVKKGGDEYTGVVTQNSTYNITGLSDSELETLLSEISSSFK